MPCDLSVILPTYDEGNHIGELLRAISRVLAPTVPSFEVIVVDDSSPDGTAREAARANEGHVRVLVRQGDRGLAAAILHGIENSAGHTLVFMDADFNHDPEDIPRLLAAVATAEVAVGSRYVPGGAMKGLRWRCWSSSLMNLLIRLGTGSSIRDNTSGFLCFKRSLLHSLDCDKIFIGYGDYCIRFLDQCQMQALSIVEVPVVYGTRRSGTSKTRFLKYSWQYLRAVQQLRTGRR